MEKKPRIIIDVVPEEHTEGYKTLRAMSGLSYGMLEEKEKLIQALMKQKSHDEEFVDLLAGELKEVRENKKAVLADWKADMSSYATGMIVEGLRKVRLRATKYNGLFYEESAAPSELAMTPSMKLAKKKGIRFIPMETEEARADSKKASDMLIYGFMLQNSAPLLAEQMMKKAADISDKDIIKRNKAMVPNIVAEIRKQVPSGKPVRYLMHTGFEHVTNDKDFVGRLEGSLRKEFGENVKVNVLWGEQKIFRRMARPFGKLWQTATWGKETRAMHKAIKLGAKKARGRRAAG
jgi:hypothetical protein